MLTWLVFVMACALFVRVRADGPIDHAIGGWAPPFGIELVVDAINTLVQLVAGMAAASAVYTRSSLAREIEHERLYPVYALLLVCLAGLIGITVTGDAFNLFVFLEISSLSSYVLIAMGARRRALLSAFQYLIMGTVGSTFLLIGVGSTVVDRPAADGRHLEQVVSDDRFRRHRGLCVSGCTGPALLLRAAGLALAAKPRLLQSM